MAGRAKTPEERAAKLALAKLTGRSQPAFGENNQAALIHGAYSSGVWQPLVEERLAAWLADPDFPEYAKALPQRFTLRSLARCQVRLELFYAAMENMSVTEAVSEVDTTREQVTGGGMSGAPMKRKSRTVKQASFEEMVRRWEGHHLNLSKELGLTPVAQAKLGRDVVAAKLDMAALIQQAEELKDEGEK